MQGRKWVACGEYIFRASALGKSLEVGQVSAQITEIQALIDTAQEVLGRDVIFQIERVEQLLLSSR